MRILVSIFFSLLLLFSAGGFHPVISLLQHRADRKLESLLHESVYDEAKLREIRISVKQFSPQQPTGYERHYGNIEVDGVLYCFIEKQTAGDSIILKCLPNPARQQLKDMRAEMTLANTALAVPQQGKNPVKNNTVKSGIGDFDDRLFHTAPGLHYRIALRDYPAFVSALNTYSGRIPAPPPRSNS